MDKEMAFSSIIRKTCKCGCDKFPDIGYEGYSKFCRPDLVEKKIKEINQRQTQQRKINKLGKTQRETIGVFEMEVQAMKTELDFVFSRIVRLREADSLGNCQCYTCPTKKHWTLIQCGHFVKRGNTLLRWNFTNARVQCKVCNEDKKGNYEVYTENLNKEQSGLADYLTEQGRPAYKWARTEIKELLIDYRAKLNLLELKFKK